MIFGIQKAQVNLAHLLCKHILYERSTNRAMLELNNDGVEFPDTREKNENFGSSLLLANSPMSPKIVNGSFAAIYDTADVFEECTKAFGQLRLEARDSPGKVN